MSIASLRAEVFDPVACAAVSEPPPFPPMMLTTLSTHALAVNPSFDASLKIRQKKTKLSHCN